MTSMNNLVQQYHKSDHVQSFLPTLTTQRFPLCIDYVCTKKLPHSATSTFRSTKPSTDSRVKMVFRRQDLFRLTLRARKDRPFKNEQTAVRLFHFANLLASIHSGRNGNISDAFCVKANLSKRNCKQSITQPFTCSFIAST